MRRLPLAGVFVVCVLLTSVPGAAVQQAPQATAQFRSATDLVVFDVSVLDKDRRPVTGLTADDFTITERGTAKPIATFAEMKIASPAGVLPGWQRDMPFDIESNDIGNRQLVVIYLADSPWLFQSRTPMGSVDTIRIGHSIVDELGPSDLAAVVHASDPAHSQDFTTDRARLRAAVDRSTSSPRPLWPYWSTGLKNVVDMLALVPDRRKTIYYVGPGADLDFSALPPGKTVHDVPFDSDSRSLLFDLQRTFGAAQRANVVIYTLDSAGLTVGAAGKPGGIDPYRHRRDWLHILANETGGRAITNTNVPERSVPALFAENTSYYLIGFAPTEPLDGKFRRLDIRVKGRDAEVRSRSGYYVEPTLFYGRREVAPANKGGALAGTIPDGELLMTIGATPIGLAGGKSTVVFSLGLEVPSNAAPPSETVTAEIGAFNYEGKMLGQAKPQLTMAVKPGLNRSAPYQLLSRIDLKPGRYMIRAAAQTKERGKRGSVFASVVVPDFTRDPISLSGIIVQSKPLPLAAPADVVKDLAPLVPVNTRQFTTRNSVDTWTRIHQGGGNTALRDVDVLTTVKDTSGAVRIERRATLAADQFRLNRFADYQFTLPAGLDAGEYLLTIGATSAAGQSASRSVRFSVK